MKNLEKANKFMMEENHKAFYEEISQATTGYIQKKYNICKCGIINITTLYSFLKWRKGQFRNHVNKYKEYPEKV
jgi:hypothetical protein